MLRAGSTRGCVWKPELDIKKKPPFLRGLTTKKNVQIESTAYRATRVS
jgi:hypothetical protein